MATISDLAVGLSLSASGFHAGLQASEQRLTSFASKVGAIGQSVAHGLLAGLGIHAVEGVGTFITDVVQGIRHTDKFAQSVGATTESMVVMREAAQNAGVPMEAFEASFQHFSRTVGAARTGSREAIGNFEQLGISIGELVNLHPEQQWALFQERIGGLTDASQRYVAVQGILGRQGKELIPMLAKGAEGLVTAKESAQQAGLIYSHADAAQLKAATRTFHELRQIIEGGITKAVIELAPLIGEVARQILETAEATVEWVRISTSGIDVVGKAAEGVQIVWQGIKAAVGLAMTGIAALMGRVTDGLGILLQKIADLADLLPDVFGGTIADGAREAGNSLRAVGEELGTKAQEIAANTKEAWAGVWRPDDGAVVDWVTGVRARMAELRKAAAANEADRATGFNKFDFADRIKKEIEASQPPLSKFRERFENLKELLDMGLPMNTFNRQASAAFEELAKGMDMIKPPEAITRGSREAESLILFNQQRRAGENRDPQQRIENVLKQQQRIQEKQLAAAEKLAERLLNPQIAMIAP